MITLDTSGLIAYLGQRDAHHLEALAAMDQDPGPYILPVAALSEMAYMLGADFRPSIEHAFLSDIRTGGYRLGAGNPDVGRIQALMLKYGDLPLGFTDAAVISCAEDHGGRVLTFDQRHFSVVARGEPRLTVLPAL